MECSAPGPTAAHTLQCRSYEKTTDWDALMQQDLKPRVLLRFMATAGLLHVHYISTTDDDACTAGFELGKYPDSTGKRGQHMRGTAEEAGLGGKLSGVVFFFL